MLTEFSTPEFLPSLFLSQHFLLPFLIFIVAILYSSVGHGGASGYLAIMSFFAFAPDEMASIALIMNILVAGYAFYRFKKSQHFKWSLTWPFLITSIPCAFIGGLLKVPMQFYYTLLSILLLFASWRLLFQTSDLDSMPLKQQNTSIHLTSGAGIGLLSGIIGVGGGIFLSPLMILMRWAQSKEVAATSALFIVFNAFSGLSGRYVRGGLILSDTLWILLISAGLGALIGSQLGAEKYSAQMLKKVLSVVLILAAVKLMIYAELFSWLSRLI